METNVIIKNSYKFRDDLKDKSAVMYLFYYYLSDSLNDSTYDDKYQNDSAISNNFEAQIKNHPGYLHILSTDIVDDTILVSKLVDPNILKPTATFVHVLYKIWDASQSDYQYRKAFVIELPSLDSKITPNDYNYLYLDLTEFGSILADLRLNNTYPIYETSHTVIDDNGFEGSGYYGDNTIMDPRTAKGEIGNTELDTISQLPSINIRNTRQYTRNYTEECYHMGDFTIRLLGKSLPNKTINKITPAKDTGMNLINVINPGYPNTRTLDYVTSDQLADMFVPRIDVGNSNKIKIPVASNKYTKILHTSYETHNNISFDLTCEGARCKVFISNDKYHVYGEYRGENDLVSSDAIYVKVSRTQASHDVTLYKFDVYYYYGESSNSHVYINNVSNTSSVSVDDGSESLATLSDATKLVAVKISSEIEDWDEFLDGTLIRVPLPPPPGGPGGYAVTRTGDVIDLNGANFDLVGLDFDNTNLRANQKLIKRFKRSFKFDKVLNNCVLMTNNVKNFPDNGNTEFDKTKCFVVRTITSNQTLSDQSRIGNILINNSNSYNAVQLSSTCIIHMPPESKFFYNIDGYGNVSNWGGFIDNGIKANWFTNPDMSDTNALNHYVYGLDHLNYSVINSGNTCFIRSNVNKVQYLINNTSNEVTATIYVHQCRYAKYNGATYGALLTDSDVGTYEGASYHKCPQGYDIPSDSGINKYIGQEAPGNITLGVYFSLPPHSLTVYANQYNEGKLSHNILYKIPIYYT